jgi:hypothetical protein
MKDILQIIENTFGQITLQVVIVFVVLYFGFTGASKLVEILRSFRSKRHSYEEKKQWLEIEKLQLEVNQLRGTLGLEQLIESPLTSTEKLQQPPPIITGRKLVLFSILSGFLQVLAWVCGGVQFLVIRYLIAGNSTDIEEWVALFIVMAIGFLSYKYGFGVFRRKLIGNNKVNIITQVISVSIAFVALILLYNEQIV